MTCLLAGFLPIAQSAARSRDDRADGTAGLAGKLLGSRSDQGSSRGHDAADRRDAAHGPVGPLGPESLPRRRYRFPPRRCAGRSRVLPDEPISGTCQQQQVFAHRHRRHRGRGTCCLRHHAVSVSPAAVLRLGPRQHRLDRGQAGASGIQDRDSQSPGVLPQGV